jgi:HSP20 family protein
VRSPARFGRAIFFEKPQGAAQRALAQDVDETTASATYEDGVLTLELPKKAATSAK